MQDSPKPRSGVGKLYSRSRPTDGVASVVTRPLPRTHEELETLKRISWGEGYAVGCLKERALRDALATLVEAKALKEVEGIVAGWNGPDPADPNPRHPSQLGAVIKTNCGRMYELAAALKAGRTALSTSNESVGK